MKCRYPLQMFGLNGQRVVGPVVRVHKKGRAPHHRQQRRSYSIVIYIHALVIIHNGFMIL